MSHREGDTFVLQRTPPAHCTQCNQLQELRPYGRGGALICVDCARLDPEETERQIEIVCRGATQLVMDRNVLAQRLLRGTGEVGEEPVGLLGRHIPRIEPPTLQPQQEYYLEPGLSRKDKSEQRRENRDRAKRQLQSYNARKGRRG